MAVSWKTILILGLISALSVGGFITVSMQFDGVGFPLDDAWIHQTYARNLADGEGWSFFPGEPSAGLTAPLWALLLSLGHLLGAGPFVITFILGWFALWGISGIGAYAWGLLSDREGWWRIGAGVLLAIEWHLVWAASSGMETLLFSVMALAALVCLIYLTKDRLQNRMWGWFSLGLLIGVSAWVRPEGLTLLGPAGFALFFSQNKWNDRLKLGLVIFLGVALAFVPYLIFNQWLADTWWPNTFYAKQAEYALHRQIPLFQRLISQFALPLVGVGVALLPGFIYLFYTSIRKREWGIIAGWLWVLGFMVLYAIRLPVTYQHGRYVMPMMPVFFLWGLAGLAEAITMNGARGLKWMLSQVWILIVPIIGVAFWIMGAQAYAKDVAFINNEMLAIAAWIDTNTNDKEVIAAHDIGALGFFAKRSTLDLAGLVSPDVIPYIRDEDKLAAYLNEHRPTYLITFPAWYPDLIRGIPLIYQTEGEFSQSPDGEGMAIYRWPERP